MCESVSWDAWHVIVFKGIELDGRAGCCCFTVMATMVHVHVSIITTFLSFCKFQGAGREVLDFLVVFWYYTLVDTIIGITLTLS